MSQYKIIQVYYDESQRGNLYHGAGFEPYYNPIPDEYNFSDGYFLFENRIISEQIPLCTKEKFVGIWSHKHYIKIDSTSKDGLFEKQANKKEEFVKWFEDKLTQDNFDVLGFHRSFQIKQKNNFLRKGNRLHGGKAGNFKKAFNYILKKSGVKLNLDSPFDFITLMNYQVSKREIYEEYVELILNPILEIMMDKKYKKLQKWLFSDSNYSGDALNNNSLQRISGTTHYTLHTFILERLFTCFLNSRNYKCINY